MEYAVPIVVAVLTGLCAPPLLALAQNVLSNWSDVRQRRRSLVDSWRNGLAQGVSRDSIRDTSWYETLRPYLSDEIREEFEMGYPENSRVHVVPGGGGTKKVNLRSHRNVLADRVDELAKGWKID